MGITTNDFFENIYSVIFSPKAFFEREDLQISIRLALFITIFIAIISKLSFGIINNEINSIFYIFKIVAHILLTIIFWLLTSLFFEYIAKIFNYSNKFKRILFYTAFATVPYIFFAPLNLLKQIGYFGYFLGVGLEFLLYLWIICLYAYAIRATYNLTLSRSFMLIFLPFIASFFAFYWIICFSQKMWYIFSI